MTKKSGRKSSVEDSSGNQSYNWGKGSWHHIISRSIGGPDIPENKYHCRVKWHRAWHQLFYNYLPSIVIKIIKEWTDEKENLNKEKMGESNFKVWKRAFGEKSPQEVIDFIEREFLPAEKKFLEGKLGGENNVRDD